MKSNKKTTNSSKHIRLFLCGDVMTGRGIDKILPYPSEPIQKTKSSEPFYLNYH